MPEEKKRARRDPEGRKRAIVLAAAELISREGTRKLTHRRVAEMAGVPLGSTTQYFSSIDELRRAGLAELAHQVEEDYGSMFRRIKERGGTADAFADELIAYLEDTEQVNTDAAFVAAAVHDPAIRDLYRKACDSVIEQSLPFMTETQAKAFMVYIDGLAMDACLLEKPINQAHVRFAIRAIMEAPSYPDDPSPGR